MMNDIMRETITALRVENAALQAARDTLHAERDASRALLRGSMDVMRIEALERRVDAWHSRFTGLTDEIAKHLSPTNENIVAGHFEAAVRDLAQIALSERGNVEELEAELAALKGQLSELTNAYAVEVASRDAETAPQGCEHDDCWHPLDADRETCTKCGEVRCQLCLGVLMPPGDPASTEGK